MREERRQPAPFEEGAIVEATIEALPLGPDSVARADGWVIFVPGGIPGERVRVRVIEAGRRYGRGEIVDVLERSPSRVEPFCPVYLRCGGCHLQHLSEESRARSKKVLVERTLSRALGYAPRVRDLVTGPGRRYRDKVALALAPRGSGIAAGFYKAHTRELVPIEDCPVQNEAATRLALGLVAALREVGAKAWDPDRETGDVRHVVVRSGDPGELYGVVVVRQEKVRWLEEFALRTAGLDMVGLALNVSPPRERDFVLGPETRVLRGTERYRTTVEGITFQVSPTSFFQTSAAGAAAIVRTVMAGLGDVKGKRVLDVFGGVGLLALHAAKRGARALVVEGNPASIADGRVSAEANRLSVSFRRGRAEDVVPRLAREGSRYDAVILDPPREGCQPRLLAAVGETLGPPTIAYVSCDPESLARDLGVLGGMGYRVEEVVPIDMFPHSYAIEAVALLRR